MFLLSGCTCVTAGTIHSACSDGQCHCDRQTGACACRENVTGHNCDQCAPNHWNYGQDGGCEPCGCNLEHAMGTHCNMVRKRKRLHDNGKMNSESLSIFCYWQLSVSVHLSLSVLYSSQASVTVTTALGVNNAPSVSSSTGETHGCGVKVTSPEGVNAHTFFFISFFYKSTEERDLLILCSEQESCRNMM